MALGLFATGVTYAGCVCLGRADLMMEAPKDGCMSLGGAVRIDRLCGPRPNHGHSRQALGDIRRKNKAASQEKYFMRCQTFFGVHENFLDFPRTFEGYEICSDSTNISAKVISSRRTR